MKKGQISDMAFVLITLLSIAITSVVALYIYTQIGDSFSTSGISTNESTTAYNAFSVAFTYIDNSFMFILIGLIIGLLISSFAIPTHPIFIVINIFGFLILVFLGAVFSNLYGDIILQEGLSTSATSFTSINFIMTRLPWIGAILVLLSSIIMYSKARSEGGY